MKLSSLALPLSVVFLGFSMQDPNPATLVHIDGTVFTQEIPAGSEHIQIMESAPFTIPAGKVLKLDSLHCGSTNSNVRIKIFVDGVAAFYRDVQFSAYARHDFTGIEFGAGKTISMTGTGTSTDHNSILAATLVDV